MNFAPIHADRSPRLRVEPSVLIGGQVAARANLCTVAELIRGKTRRKLDDVTGEDIASAKFLAQVYTYDAPSVFIVSTRGSRLDLLVL